MANRRDAQSVMIIGFLALLVAGTGLYLGFRSPTGARTSVPVPHAPDQGAILYEMRSVRSDPDRVQLEWKDMAGASGYRVTILSAEDESLFVGPTVSTTVWTIPTDLRTRLKRQTVYHWRLTVFYPEGTQRVSEPAAFATQ